MSTAHYGFDNRLSLRFVCACYVLFRGRAAWYLVWIHFHFLDICLQSFSKQTTHCLKIDIVEKVGFPFDCGYLFLSYGHYTLVLGRLHQFEQFDQGGTWCGYNLVRVLLL